MYLLKEGDCQSKWENKAQLNVNYKFHFKHKDSDRLKSTVD